MAQQGAGQKRIEKKSGERSHHGGREPLVFEFNVAGNAQTSNPKGPQNPCASTEGKNDPHTYYRTEQQAQPGRHDGDRSHHGQGQHLAGDGRVAIETRGSSRHRSPRRGKKIDDIEHDAEQGDHQQRPLRHSHGAGLNQQQEKGGKQEGTLNIVDDRLGGRLTMGGVDKIERGVGQEGPQPDQQWTGEILQHRRSPQQHHCRHGSKGKSIPVKRLERGLSGLVIVQKDIAAIEKGIYRCQPGPDSIPPRNVVEPALRMIAQ